MFAIIFSEPKIGRHFIIFVYRYIPMEGSGMKRQADGELFEQYNKQVRTEARTGPGEHD